MTNYGFRLFRVTVHRSGRGDALSVEVGVGESKQHIRDYLFDLVSARKLLECHGTPTASDLDDADDGVDEEEITEEEQAEAQAKEAAKPVLVVTDVDRRGDHMVIEYVYGRRQGFTGAGYAGNGAAPLDISDLKSVRPYRAVFMFPDVGELGIAAVEDASRTHASKKLEQWMRAWAREDGKAEAAEEAETTGKKIVRPVWWSLRFTPLSDPEKLKSLMTNGTSSKIVLTKQGGSDTNTPGKSPLKVEMGLSENSAIARARKVLNGWIEYFNGPATAPGDAQTQATKDLAAVLGDSYDNFDDQDYDDAWIEVKDADGKKKEISPSRWADIFIYPVSRGVDCPTSRLFFGRVQRAVAPLENSLEVSVDWAGWGVEDGEI